MASDECDFQDDVLCSPPSWEALAAEADESDPEDDDAQLESGNSPVFDDERVETKAVLDVLLCRSRSASFPDDGHGEEEGTGEGSYPEFGSKGYPGKEAHSTRKSVIFRESGERRDFAGDRSEKGEPDAIAANDSDVAYSNPVQIRKEAFGQRSRTPSDRDSESVYDTVSSTSSAAPLLRKIAHYLPAETPPEAGDSRDEATASRSTSLESIGRALLAKTLEQVKKSLEDLSPSPEAEVYHDIMGGPGVRKVSRIYLKNLAVLSVCFMILHTAFFSLRNLQSSINHRSGLGLAGLSCLSASYIISCLFAPSVVQKVRPKYALIFSMSGHLVFQAANFCPSFYTIVPASVLLGCTMASLWVAQGSYLTSVAVTYASATGKRHDGVIGLFNGFFLFWLQTAQILGNLLSSFVFDVSIWSDGGGPSASAGASSSSREQRPPVAVEYGVVDLDGDARRRWVRLGEAAVSNLTSDRRPAFCGAKYCHSYVIEHPDLHLGRLSLYVLLTIFLALTIISMTIVALFLDKLDVIFRKNQASLRQQLVTIVRFHDDYKVWLLCLLLIFVGMQQAYMFGEVTKAFINCPLGIHMIGYVMVCFGACDSLMSFTCGQLQRCSSAKVFITIGAILHLVLLGVMLLWEPSANDVLLVFVLAGSLGAADAIWQTQICNMIGYLFPTNRETAFGCLRMYEGIGFTLAFAYAQYLCMTTKTYILIGVLLVGLTCYYVMEHLEKKYKTAATSFPPVDV